MRLTAKILNSDASLNSWKVLGSFDFMPGEDLTLKLRLFDEAEGIRYMPPADAELTVFFQTTSGEDLEKTATLDPDDRALATVELSAAETEEMIGGSLLLELDVNGDGSEILKGVVRNAVRLISSDC